MRRRTVLVDGMMLAHRCFHKMDFLKNSKGQPTGMEFGFIRSLWRLERDWQNIIICWDGKPKNDKGRGKCPFGSRLKALKEYLPYDQAVSDLEADDVMFTLNGDIYTNDDDLLVCCNERYVVKSYRNKLFYWDAEKVKEKYFVGPECLLLMRAVIGDRSDNLPGVPRINKRKLAELIYPGDPLEVWQRILDADWSEKMMSRLLEHPFAENYSIMKLRKVDVRWSRGDGKLKPEWEFKSLEEF